MDPEVSLTEAFQAIERDDPQAAAERLFAYYQWRLKGGAMPYNGDSRAALLAARCTDLIRDPADI